MKIEDFEKELKAIDVNLSIRPNNPPARVLEAFPDTAKLAVILYRGSEVCSIPNYDIYDEPNPNYGVDLRQDGRFVKHRTRPDALAIVNQTLDRLKNDKEYSDSFFGEGEYSEQSLRAPAPVGEVTIVEDVEITPQEIISGSLEQPKE